jgi:hypothetical protein
MSGCEHNSLWACDRCARDRDQTLIDKLRAENAKLRACLERIAETAHGYGSDCHCNGCRAKEALAAKESK